METLKQFCDGMDLWANISIRQEGQLTPGFDQAWKTVRLAIAKSCLLDRMFYGGEKPSQTPCPIHKGRWSGCHFTWPGRMSVYVIDTEEHKKGDQVPVVVPQHLQEWYDAGCRCAYHSCGCTTGWQPDEHCGCGGEEHWKQEMSKK